MSLKAASKMCVFMFLYLCRGENLLLTSEHIIGSHTFFFFTLELNVMFSFTDAYILPLTRANTVKYNTLAESCVSSVIHIHQTPVDCSDVTEVSSCLLSRRSNSLSCPLWSAKDKWRSELQRKCKENGFPCIKVQKI